MSKALIAAVLGMTLVSAQSRDAGGSGAPPMGGMLTPFEQIVERLKLDNKTQLPAVQQIFTAAAIEAAPVGQDISLLRQRMLDAELSGKADDFKTALEAYRAAAAKMTGLETQAFVKVYALLKPNQQSKAPQAFEWMGGLLMPAAPGGRARRGGGL
jgi:hypothetical protein